MNKQAFFALAMAGVGVTVSGCSGSNGGSSADGGANTASSSRETGSSSSGGGGSSSTSGGSSAGGGLDAGVRDAASNFPPGDGSISQSLPARYPSSVIHSPITTSVVNSINAIVASHHRDPQTIMRFGDANCGAETTAWEQPNPLMQSIVGLPNKADFQPTADYFSAHKIAAADPNGFGCMPGTCSSLSWVGFFCNDGTLVVTNAFQTSNGQTLLAQELGANPGAFGLIQFGGGEQDVSSPKTGPGAENGNINGYGGMGFAQGTWELSDELIAQGVVPVLRGFANRWFPTNDFTCSKVPSGGYPPATVPYSAAGTGPLMDTIKRAIAEARQVPFASFLVRADQNGAIPPYTIEACGLHYTGGASDFTDMKLGGPIDSLTVIEQLDRLRKVAQSTWTPDPNPGPARAGSGSATDPFIVDGLPFGDLRDLSAAPAPTITDYSKCAPSDQGVPTMDGPAYVYRLDITDPAGLAVRLSLTSRCGIL